VQFLSFFWENGVLHQAETRNLTKVSLDFPCGDGFFVLIGGLLDGSVPVNSVGPLGVHWYPIFGVHSKPSAIIQTSHHPRLDLGFTRIFTIKSYKIY